MSKESLKSIIDLIDERDTDTIYKVLVRFIPEDMPLPDEIEAIESTNKSIAEGNMVPFDTVNWD